MQKLRAPTTVSADSEGSGPAAARGPAAVLRGSGPRRATRCGGRLGVHEPVTARDEVAVPVTAIEVAPVPITAGDVATVPVTAGPEASVPVTAGDVVWRVLAERPRRTLHRAKGEGGARSERATHGDQHQQVAMCVKLRKVIWPCVKCVKLRKVA